MQSPFDVPLPRVFLAVLALAVLGTGVYAASTSAAAFGAFNPQWDGTADVRTLVQQEGVAVETVLDTAAYPTDASAANGTVALVLSPGAAYGPMATERLRQFVRRGGTLIVAEDVGPHGDDLLAGVGASARFHGAILRNERAYYRSPAMPLADRVTDSPLVASVSQLTLNHGTSVLPNGATVLVRADEFTYRDLDGNGALNDPERLGTYPVATVEQVGDGRVVAVGDPSLFINAMLDREGNRQFLRALVDGETHLLLDQSHTGSQPPLAVGLVTLRRSPFLQALVGLIAVGAVLAAGTWVRRTGADRSTAPDRPPSELRNRLVDRLADTHDWDRNRVRRLMAGILGHRAPSEDDD